jgi:hypothetical protein
MTWLREHRIEVKYALIAVVLIGGLVALERAGVLGRWAQGLDPVFEALAGFGLLGAFLLGLLGNSSLLLQVPYTIPMLSAALAGAPLAYLVGLAVAAGLGATVGELVSYTIADQVLRRQRLSDSRLFRWVHRTVHDHPRAIPWLVLGFAITLLPDDAVLIPLAMVSYGAGRLVVPLLLGKLGYCIGCALLFDLLGTQAARWVSPHATADLAIVGLVGFLLVVLYQAERARAGSVAPADEEGRDGAQDSDRAGAGLRSGLDHRGGGRRHQAAGRPR